MPCKTGSSTVKLLARATLPQGKDDLSRPWLFLEKGNLELAEREKSLERGKGFGFKLPG